MFNVKVTDEQIVRILIYEIRDRYPDVVNFIVTPQDVKSILLYLITKKYDTIMYLYGYKFLIGILKMYEEYENFEECAEIIKQIKEHNIYFKEEIPYNF